MGFWIERVNVNDNDPFFDLAMGYGGTELESLFHVTFLQRCWIRLYAFHSNNFLLYHQNSITYKAVKNDSCDKNLSSYLVRLLFDQSLKWNVEYFQPHCCH